MSKEKESVTKHKKGGLGRGLSALLNNAETDITVSSEYRASGGVQTIDIKDIEANPFQPRTDFEQKALDELSESIKIHGLIQPVTVRKMGYDKFQLISGERRTRASILAGLDKIPAYIRIANDQEMLEMALIENIQREDLNAIEISLSYQRLMAECDLKQEELGDRVGKNRTTINNYLRLLKLPPDIQIALRDGKISMGHARAIISVENIDAQLDIFKKILKEGLSVRKVEELVRDLDGKSKSPVYEKPNVDPEIVILQRRLTSHFGTKIQIKSDASNKGEIKIPFSSSEDFERILELLKL